MTEQELREKIARIIAKHLCKNRYSHFQLYGDSANCYSRENFAECEAVCNAVDDLIAAGIGDVKDLQAQVDALEMTNIALQAGYDGAEKDRLYWVDKYKEAEHRAEVYKRALHIAHTAGEFAYYVEKAEKELQEDRKDD